MAIATLAPVKRAIEASTTMSAPFEQVREVLADDPGAMVAEIVTPEDRAARRFRSSLGVELGGGGAVRQAVEITIGSPHVTDAILSLPLHWRATGRDRLFPVFEGHLTASPADGGSTLLMVAGTYTVPLGPVGRFGDGLIGRRLARQSLTSFVEDVARRIDAEVHRRTTSVDWRPAHHPVSLRESAAEPAAEPSPG
ncbi:MAG: hypothetical protein C0P77_007205 [Thermoanaerobacterales bacterium]|nr:hypothetical protein [Thermoanaerobacterales bacterium]